MHKAISFALLSILTLAAWTQASQPTNAFAPNATLKWAPTGLIVGSLSCQGEYATGKRSSLTAKIGLPVAVKHTLDYDGNDADFRLKATSFMAGYRIYLSRQQLKGLYFEPFLKYVKHSGKGTGNNTLGMRDVTLDFTNDYEGFGIGAQLGAQFRIANRFVIDLFLVGPEINTAENSFLARETSSVIPWTQFEAQDAERQVRDFIDEFPFVRNHTTVAVNREAKTVAADFKGALPGFRTGISFGLAF